MVDRIRSKPLDELIKMSVEHNPSLQSAEASIRIAQYTRAGPARAFLPADRRKLHALPTADLRRVRPGPNGQSPSVFSLHTAQLNVSFVPDIWGQNIREVESRRDIRATIVPAGSGLPRADNVVTAAIQEASLRGQIAAIQRRED